VQLKDEGQQLTLYWLGQKAPKGQQAMKGKTVRPQLTSFEGQVVAFRRMAKPDGLESAIVDG